MGLAQSSMASSWSARASNMVLMSSRMCLVEVLGGLQWGKDLVRSVKNQITPPTLGKGADTEHLVVAKCFSRILILTPSGVGGSYCPFLTHESTGAQG